MASQCSTSANAEGQQRLLKMVNDQRARCKLTSLESVMNQTGINWVESIIQHARDTYQDHISNAVSEAEMNVNILRSPKKDKQKQAKKTTSSKKTSPFKKSRMPKASTPPKMMYTKPVLASRTSSPSPSAPSPQKEPEASISQIKKYERPSSVFVPDIDAPIAGSSIQSKSSTPINSPVKAIKSVAAEAKTLTLTKMAAESYEQGKETIEEDRLQKGADRKRKSQESREETERKRKKDDEVLQERKNAEEAIQDIPKTLVSEANGSSSVVPKMVGPAKDVTEIIVIDDTNEEEEIAALKEFVLNTEEEKMMEDLGEDKDNEGKGGEKEEEKEISMIEMEKDEEEVSRVIAEDLQLNVKDMVDENVSIEIRKEEVREVEDVKVVDVARSISPIAAESTEGTKDIDSLSQDSIDESFTSLDRKSLRSEDIISEGEVEPAPSSSSATSAPKPSLRERIDRFRAIFSPAPRPASSIPRPSPPKIHSQSPPRPVQHNSSPSRQPISSQLGLISRPKSPAKAASFKAAIVATVPKVMVAATSAPPPPPTVKQALPVKAAPAKISVPIPIKATAPVAAPAIPLVKTAAASVKVVAPTSIKVTSQSKNVKVVKQQLQQVSAAPAMANNNPFQKAQQQQQQAALVITSTLRAKIPSQAVPSSSTSTSTQQQPLPSTADIELEEPDSAYSDSDDEETVKRRQQHKAWETKEGLAKALEEQATIDADAIFGIPHGVVPIDDILPPETDQARAKRARPRSSSATWSRDGLKQVEIDRYNARMGIEGPGVRLPTTSSQDDGSGTPSRFNRLSAIAQSAIHQGQVSRKPSTNASRASVSPLRPTASSSIRPGSASAQSKYPHLLANTPTSTKTTSIAVNSTQKSKHPKTAEGVSGQLNKQTTTKTKSKNPFQNGVSSTLQTGRLANSGLKAPTVSEAWKK
ncbi:hypothetical protein CBS101457_001444 [Exobasidium rhododendri]|nr:hypothetical protein CBS101457_001444 [Exobasidium rhododendri]